MSLPIMPKCLPLRALIVALVLAGAAAPALAQSRSPAPPSEEHPGELARDAIEKMMRALSLAIENLPQYALPELNENGDIIIRRLNPRAEKPRPRPPENPDETRT
ncbi:MAG TPA: hypothetical protein VHM01_12705 [Alphaproteobacteria bacterium]|nr:hypothetical protein [Alphaproteobacteria bacterium]